MSDSERQADLIAAARAAAAGAYAPYSNFHVGAALLFADGTVVTGANVENASYGLSLCAETVAVAKVLSEGASGTAHGALLAVAVTGGAPGAPGQGATVTPCGRCRQTLNEIADLTASDPEVWCDGEDGVLATKLSVLLPHAFGPGNLG
jgi:cytidine deaminase